MRRTIPLTITLVYACCSPQGNVQVQKKSPPTSIIRGTVILHGEPPPKKLISLNRFPECAALHPAGLTMERVVIDTQKRVQGAIVYVKSGLKDNAFDASNETPLAFSIRACQFSPHVFGVGVGQHIVIRNEGSEFHSFHTVSKLNLPQTGTLLSQSVKTVSFPKPEIGVSIRCDVHPWEEAWANVFDHLFYSVTESGGAFEIRGLAPGKYVLGVWHEYYESVTQTVELSGQESVTVDFILEAK